MLSTDQKGNIAEQAVALAATRLGLGVYRPVGEGGRYDLIVDLGVQLLRVQCKWARRHGDVVSVPCYSNRRAREGLRRRLYTKDEIDAIAAYCQELDRCFLLPAAWLDGRQQVHLRLEPARNGQDVGLNWAHMFDFAAVDWSAVESVGAIAQLGERRHGMAEVVGSSPTSSTPAIDRAPSTTIGADELCQRLGSYLALASSGQEILVTRRGRPRARIVPP